MPSKLVTHQEDPDADGENADAGQPTHPPSQPLHAYDEHQRGVQTGAE